MEVKFELITVSGILFCMMDVLLCGRFFGLIFSRRLSRAKYIMWAVAIALTITLENSFGNTWLNLLCVPVIYMVFSKLAFRLSPGNCVGYTIIYYIIFAGGREAIFGILYSFLEALLKWETPAWFTFGGIPFLLLEYLSAYLLLLYTKKYIKKMEIESDSRFCWYLLIMPIASLLVMIIFIYMEFPSSTMIQILVCGGTFLIYVSNVAVFVILSNLTQEMKRIKLSELSDLKQELERRNFERIEQANEVYRRFLHDVHHYYAQFRNLAAQGETRTIVGIIDELEGKLATDEKPVFYISDPVMNSILIEYEKQAKEKGIKCSIFVEERLDVGFISDGDKISMFGNLLLNAIEAASECAEEERGMQVELFMGNRNMLVLQVENTYCHKLRIEGGHGDKGRKNISLLSTKPDAGSHGLGIGIVRELAKKYGGSLTLSQEKGQFTAVLTLSRHLRQNIE